MSELIGEPIETDRAKKLREWLAKPEGYTLRLVINAKMQLAQKKFAAAAMKSDDANAYSAASILDLRAAKQYQTFLTILDDIANPETPLETIKLKT